MASSPLSESDPGLQAMALSTSSTESDPLIDSIDAGYDESSLRDELDLDRRLPGKVTELAFLQAALLIQDSSTLNIPPAEFINRSPGRLEYSPQ